jgi:hypothetical protein
VKYVKNKVANPVNKRELEEKYSQLAHKVNHNQPHYNGIRYHEVQGNRLSDLRSRAELVMEQASEEERDSIRIRMDCVNALAGEGFIFDLRECPRREEILKEIEDSGEELFPWGEALRMNGRDKGKIFYRALDKVYGKERFQSILFINDGSWNGRGTLLRI